MNPTSSDLHRSAPAGVPCRNRRLRLAIAVAFLALPAWAGAVTVNSAADLAPGGACEPAPGDCTLREAIDEVNAAGRGTITFDPAVFPPSGNTAPAIVLAEPLPSITASRVVVDGRRARVVVDGTAAMGIGLGFESGAGPGGVSRVTVREITLEQIGIQFCGGTFATACDGPISRVLVERVAVLDAGGRGIEFEGGPLDRVNVRNVVVMRSASFGVDLKSAGAVTRSGVYRSTLRESAAGGGIRVFAGADIVNLRLEDNDVGSATGTGIRVQSSTGDIRGARLDGNAVSEATGSGMLLVADQGDIVTARVLNNLVNNTASGRGIELAASSGVIDRAQVKGNVARGNGTNGIRVSQGADGVSRLQMVRNDASGNGVGGPASGIQVSGSRGQILRNTANGNSGAGIVVGEGERNRVERNVTNGNDTGITTSPGASRTALRRNESLGNDTNDLADFNADCGDNVWRSNRFGSSSLECIR